MDGVTVQLNIVEVHSDSSHVFLSHGGFLGGPLEGTFHGLSDFVHELNSSGNINQHIGTNLFGTIGPDLLGLILVPFEFLDQILGSFFGILFGTSFPGFNGIGKFQS